MPPSSSLARAKAQHANELTAIYFAASIAALSAIVIVVHLVGVALGSTPRGKGALGRRVVSATRHVRSALLHEVPFFNTFGNTLVFAAYIIINVTLTLQNFDHTLPAYWAKRAGWMAKCNLALITFLALKNTPLAFLTGHSYERLNILHQAAGYCTVFFALFHGLCFVSVDAKAHFLSGFTEPYIVMGEVAGIGMIIILTTALILRKIRYEAFYIVHITMFMLIVISLGMHRLSFDTKSIYIIIFTASIWFSDRLLRGVRIVFYSFSNRATIYPLAHGGVRIVLQRTPWRATPGSHVFLWIPAVRAIETHPFTVVSTNPLELVVSAHDGFTRDLFSRASESPGAILRTSCDGPYGALPNFSKFNRVVLVAGGSGATFTLGVALSLIRKNLTAGARPMIHFILVVRNQEMRTWFMKELTELNASPLVDVKTYVTRSIGASTSSSESDSEDTRAQAKGSTKSETDPEKLAEVSVSPIEPRPTLPIILGRPNVSAIIRSIVASSEEHESTIIGACGPASLMTDTRAVVVDLVAKSGRSVALHCEQFGW